MDEFFSFYGFYQDVINDLQDNCNYEGRLTLTEWILFPVHTAYKSYHMSPLSPHVSLNCWIDTSISQLQGLSLA